MNTPNPKVRHTYVHKPTQAKSIAYTNRHNNPFFINASDFPLRKDERFEVTDDFATLITRALPSSGKTSVGEVKSMVSRVRELISRCVSGTEPPILRSELRADAPIYVQQLLAITTVEYCHYLNPSSIGRYLQIVRGVFNRLPEYWFIFYKQVAHVRYSTAGRKFSDIDKLIDVWYSDAMTARGLANKFASTRTNRKGLRNRTPRIIISGDPIDDLPAFYVAQGKARISEAEIAHLRWLYSEEPVFQADFDDREKSKKKGKKKRSEEQKARAKEQEDQRRRAQERRRQLKKQKRLAKSQDETTYVAEEVLMKPNDNAKRNRAALKKKRTKNVERSKEDIEKLRAAMADLKFNKNQRPLIPVFQASDIEEPSFEPSLLAKFTDALKDGIASFPTFQAKWTHEVELGASTKQWAEAFTQSIGNVFTDVGEKISAAYSSNRLFIETMKWVLLAMVLHYVATRIVPAVYEVVKLALSLIIPEKLREYVMPSQKPSFQGKAIEVDASAVARAVSHICFFTLLPKGFMYHVRQGDLFEAISSSAHRVATYKGNTNNIESFVSMGIQALNTCLVFICDLLGKEPVRIREKVDRELSRLCETVDDFYTQYSRSNFETGDIQVFNDKLAQVQWQHDQITAMRSEYIKFPSVLRVLDTLEVKVTTILKRYASSMSKLSGIRVVPVPIILAGKPGVGKTTMATRLAFSALVSKYPHFKDYTWDRLLYTPDEGDYSEGYIGQPLYCMSELGMKVPVPGSPNDAVDLCSMIDSSPLPLNMAFGGKGSAYFRSLMVVSTTNMTNLGWATKVMNNSHALKRRLQNSYVVEFSDHPRVGEFLKQNDSTGQTELSKTAVVAYEERTGAYPWFIWKFQHVQFTESTTVPVTGEWVTAREIMLRLADQLALNKQIYESERRGSAKSTDIHSEHGWDYIPVEEPPTPPSRVSEIVEDVRTTAREQFESARARSAEIKDAAKVAVDNFAEGFRKGLSKLGNLPLFQAGDFWSLGDWMEENKVPIAAAAVGVAAVSSLKRNNRNTLEVTGQVVNTPSPMDWEQFESEFSMIQKKVDVLIFDYKRFIGFLGAFLAIYIGAKTLAYVTRKVASAFDTSSLSDELVHKIKSASKRLTPQQAEVALQFINKLHGTGPEDESNLNYFAQHVPNAMQLPEVLRSNVVVISAVKGETRKVVGFMLGISGHHYLTNYHTDGILSKVPEGYTIDLRFYKKDEMAVQLTQAQWAALPRATNPARDVSLLSIKSFVNHVRGLQKFFLQREEIDKFQNRAVVIETPVVGFETKVFTPQRSSHYSVQHVPEIGGMGATRSLERSIMMLDVSTDAGDCGSPIYLDTPIGSKFILGIHSAGFKGVNCAYGTSVDRELLDELSKELAKQDPAERVIDDLVFNSGMVPAVFPGEEGLLFSNAYQVDKDKGVAANPQTQLAPTRLGEMLRLTSWPAPKKLPAKLRPFQARAPTNGSPALSVAPGTLIDPMRNALKPYGTVEHPLLHLDEEDVAAAAYAATLPLRESAKGRKFRALSFEEGVAGIIGRASAKGIPRGTSSGFPLCTHFTSGKKPFFGRGDEYEFTSEACEAVREEVKRILTMANEGKRVEHVFKDFLKDELRSEAKVLSGQTRLISSAPLAYLIAFRMLFLDLFSHIQEQHILVGTAVGINVFTEWDIMVRHITRYSEMGFAGDFKGFDARQLPQILIAVGRNLASLYDDEWAVARNVLWYDVFNSRHIGGPSMQVSTIVYDWCRSLPSGHPGTTIINSFYNLTLFILCYRDATGNEYSRFWKQVGINVYGDDNIVFPHADIAPVFNQHTLPALMRKYGMEYTSEDKEGKEVPALRHVEEMSFLKRGFRKVLNQYVCPLEPESIFVLPLYTNCKAREAEIQAQNLEMMLREMALHGKEFFDEYGKKLIWGMNTSYGIVPKEQPTYDRYFNLAKESDNPW